MLKNKKEIQEYLEKVDAVCIECINGKEKICAMCPVRKTVDRLTINENKPTTKTLLVTVQCMATYDSVIEVPANLTIDEAIEYAKEHIDEISLGELEYVQESDQLDEDNCCFDDDDDDDDATQPAFKIGSTAIFTTTQSDLEQYDCQTVTIQRILSEDECDIDEVGYMYEVMTFNGNKFQAFEDELF